MRDYGTSCRAVQPHDEWYVIDFPGRVSAWIGRTRVPLPSPPSQMLVMFFVLHATAGSGHLCRVLSADAVELRCQGAALCLHISLGVFMGVRASFFNLTACLTHTRRFSLGPSVQRGRISEAKNFDEYGPEMNGPVGEVGRTSLSSSDVHSWRPLV